MPSKSLKTVACCLLLTANCLLLTNCGQDYFFEKKIDIPGQSWTYGNLLEFEFEVADTTKTYAILLDVTHAGDFGFQNCYVQISTRFPSGEEKKQPVSLELAAQTGIWNGECSGSFCTVEIPLQGKARFRETGRHSIVVEQFMRQDPLPGIKSISLKIKQLE
ncbi:MAG: gliding motility lipoprotein GldH [Bacteroidetes bacterium]|nr:gliding motility lipoprotein GldH [Bacteroidota bacterium]